MIPLGNEWAERRFAACFAALAALQPAARRLVDHLVARAASAPSPP
jgi:hypothetical protein